MVAGLPRIIRFKKTDDSPGASCPHCGAEGHYILRFDVEGPNGPEPRAAMRGCTSLFPVSAIAREELRLVTKQADYIKKGWKGLNRGDAAALAAIERFYAGEMDERAALGLVKAAKAANQMRHRR